ncbi:MAG: DUF3899 domain-containing protein [Defluviitaleaceae bacterium]|nr:DUF3899 domain-containing protein [Defluviitaleaceae bacterium]
MLKAALANRNKLIILFAIILIYGAIHFALSDNHPLHILSNICFHVGIFGLGYALLLELLNRNYFKMFAYPIYYFVESRKAANRRKHGMEAEKPLSPYDYEQKGLKKRKNTIFYIIGGVFIILSIIFAILFQPYLAQL